MLSHIRQNAFFLLLTIHCNLMITDLMTLFFPRFSLAVSFFG